MIDDNIVHKLLKMVPNISWHFFFKRGNECFTKDNKKTHAYKPNNVHQEELQCSVWLRRNQ